MKKMNIFISFFMALVMIVSIIPMSTITASAENLETSGACGENLTWTFDNSTGTLTISGTGPMQAFESVSETPWFSFRDCVKTLIISDGVTTISEGTFIYYENLTSVTIGDSVTAIGDVAFLQCTGLASLTIPDSVTSIGYMAFAMCESLTSLTIGDNVTTISEGAFFQCTSLEGVIIPDKVTTISNDTFGECTSLKNVTFGSGVTTIGDYAFASCTSLTSVVLPDSVTEIGVQAFCDCTNLSNVTFGKNVKTIGEMAFGNCTSLVSVVIPDSVTTIGDMAFAMCEGLKSVTIGNGVTTINYATFLQCKGLTEVTFGKNVKTIGEMAFAMCEGLETIIIPDSVTKIDYAAFQQCTGLDSAVIGNNVTTIEDKAFSMCENLASVTIGDSVTTINYGTFLKCASLTEVTFGKNITTIGEFAFAYCNNLSNITIPDSVTTIDYAAFLECTSLNSVIIPDSVETIGNVAFGGCSKLDSIVVDTNNQYYLSDEYGVLFNKDKTILIQYPNASTKTSYTIPDSVTIIEDGAFDNCPSLTDVHYVGSEEQWKQITIREDNDSLLNATIHFNSSGEHKHDYTTVITAPTCTEQGYTTYTCSCGDSYVSDYTDPTHTSGEWETVLAPTYEADGKKVKKCTVCSEVVAEEVIPMLVKVTVTDEDTGVSMEYGESDYNGEVKIVVEESFDGTAFDIIDTSLKASQKFIYDITMTVDGVETQPNGAVTVKIPLPAGYDPNRSFVYYVDTTTGKVEKMPAKYENGYFVFETDHFSYYAVVEEDDSADVLIGDVNSDGKINTLDRVVLTRYIAKWEEYLEGSINMTAADVNGDGKVNTLDRVVLTRYIAKWEGYETLPYSK